MLDASTFSLPLCHRHQVNVLQFDATGELLASSRADGLLNIWSFKRQAYIVSHQFLDGITAMTWLVDCYGFRSHSVVVALHGGAVEQLCFSMENVSAVLAATRILTFSEGDGTGFQA